MDELVEVVADIHRMVDLPDTTVDGAMGNSRNGVLEKSTIQEQCQWTIGVEIEILKMRMVGEAAVKVGPCTRNGVSFVLISFIF